MVWYNFNCICNSTWDLTKVLIHNAVWVTFAPILWCIWNCLLILTINCCYVHFCLCIYIYIYICPAIKSILNCRQVWISHFFHRKWSSGLYHQVVVQTDTSTASKSRGTPLSKPETLHNLAFNAWLFSISYCCHCRHHHHHHHQSWWWYHCNLIHWAYCMHCSGYILNISAW